jgi:hypothetical protein
LEGSVVDIASLSTTNRAGADSFSASAFREADFMAIMLAEITQQDPLDPADTSDMVKGMQQLQELANTQFEKYRKDIDWAQNLMGQTVTVGQANMTQNEYDSALERGLNPDRGFGTATGPVVYFRNVGESVWVRIGEYDYPIDNVQTVAPELLDETYFTNMASDLVGRQVGYIADDATFQEGVVEQISWDQYGMVSIHIDGEEIPFERLRAIGGS